MPPELLICCSPRAEHGKPGVSSGCAAWPSLPLGCPTAMLDMNFHRTPGAWKLPLNARAPRDRLSGFPTPICLFLQVLTCSPPSGSLPATLPDPREARFPCPLEETSHWISQTWQGSYFSQMFSLPQEKHPLIANMACG